MHSNLTSLVLQFETIDDEVSTIQFEKKITTNILELQNQNRSTQTAPWSQVGGCSWNACASRQNSRRSSRSHGPCTAVFRGVGHLKTARPAPVDEDGRARLGQCTDKDDQSSSSSSSTTTSRHPLSVRVQQQQQSVVVGPGLRSLRLRRVDSFFFFTNSKKEKDKGTKRTNPIRFYNEGSVRSVAGRVRECVRWLIDKFGLCERER